RRYVLAFARTRLEAGLQPLCAGVAPSPEFAASLLETAEGIRQGRTPFAKEMAGEIQFRWTPDMAGAPFYLLAAVYLRGGEPDLSRPMGDRAFSIALRTRAGNHFVVVYNAGVVLGQSGFGLDWHGGAPVEATASRPACCGGFGRHFDRKRLR